CLLRCSPTLAADARAQGSHHRPYPTAIRPVETGLTVEAPNPATLDVLKNMYEYRVARWNDEMTRMHQEREIFVLTIVFTVQRV
ncbi:hypothetical protein M378DRAFT_172547, partial [Amanita muscaria Koide BX008]